MEYFLHILVIAGIYIILTLSLNLVVGFTGMTSLGHVAFACIGAYASALLALNYGLSPWLGLIFSAIVAAVFGIIIGIPSIRLKGDYLALATFGLGIIIYSVAKNWVSLTKGTQGLRNIPGFSLLGLQLSENWSYLILVTFCVLLSYLTIRRIVESPYGMILKAIREDETAVLAIGKNANKFKISAFVIGAIFAGIAGSLYAHYITYIDAESFTVMESITILLMVVLGGMGSLGGSFVGALILVFFPELLRSLGMPDSVAAPLRQMIYGLLLIVLMIYRPSGILGKYKFQR